MKRIIITLGIATTLTLCGVVNSYSQNLQQEMVKTFIQALGPQGLNGLMRSVADQIGSMPEVKEQLIKEFVRQIGPEDLKTILGSLAQELAADPEFKSRLMRTMAQAAQSGAMAGFGSSSMSSRLPSHLQARLSKAPETAPALHSGSVLDNAVRAVRGDLVAIITHPSNPVQSLTMEDVKKLVSGEYDNWQQVGGPDLPVRVVVWTHSQGSLEDALNKNISNRASKLPFLSLLLPSVNQNKGSLGLIPTRNMEQLEFIVGHEAIKKVAIKSDQDTPAVYPSRKSLADGSYPVMTKPVAMVSFQKKAGESTGTH